MKELSYVGEDFMVQYCGYDELWYAWSDNQWLNKVSAHTEKRAIELMEDQILSFKESNY